MTYIKRYGSKLLWILLEILLLLFLSTILYYFDWIGPSTYSFLKIVIVLGSILVQSYRLGRESQKKGYLEGFLLGLVLIGFLFLFSLFITSWQWKRLIYYFLILSTTTLGSMIGISQKKKKKDYS